MTGARPARMKARVVVGLLFATVSVASADEIALHRGDSVKVHHKRYYCEPYERGHDGVTLSAGDSITVGDRRITCEAAAVVTAPPPPPPTLEITSRVDKSCLDSLYMKVSGSLDAQSAMGLARACRNVEFGRSCRVTSSQLDNGCFQKLSFQVSGSLPDDMAGRVQDACKQLTASCVSAPANVSSKVDVDCYQRLYMSTSGKPSMGSALGWLRSCRSAPIDRCTIVSGQVDNSCVQAVYMSISGNLTPAQAGDVARACRSVQASCDGP